MGNILESDLFRYNREKSIIRGLKKPGFAYMYFFRKASICRPKSLKYFVLKLVLKRLSYKYGYQIPVGTKIGKGLYLGHFGTVVINQKATIGENCNIAHTTTIGQVNTGKLKGFPHIGNFVWIGTGSVIVGNIKIGNNVFIAPNTFVNMNIPDNSLVIGNPAKILEKVDPTNGYINNVLE